MKKLLFLILSTGLLMVPYGCVDDPKMTPGVIGAQEPEFEGAGVIVGKTASSITVRAKVSKENGDKITERGFYYGLNDPPTTKIQDDNTGIGEYTLTIERLTNNERYFIRPYAVNSKGTGYGVTLFDSTNIGIVGVETLIPDSIYATSAKVGGRIGFEGEGEVRSMGFYLYKKDDITAIDTIYCDTTYPVQPKSGMDFYCHLTLLTPSTEYYVSAFVTNSYGTTVGSLELFVTLDGKPVIGTTTEIEREFTEVTLKSSVTNGGDETVIIVERGFCWVINTESSEPTILNNVVKCGAGEGEFEGTITELVSNARYYARAYAISDLGITAYGDSILSIQTKKDIPTVTTNIVTNMQGGNAYVSGRIEDEGRYPVIASGICWSATIKEPTLSASVLPLTAGSNGEFSGQLTRLRGGVTYYACAYATNSEGTTVYGEVRQFTTPAIFTTGLMAFPGIMRFVGTLAYSSIEGYLYILGGDHGASYTDELWRYSIATNEWYQCRSFIGSPARYQTSVTYGLGMFAYGGDNGKGDEKPGIYYYQIPPDNNWSYYDGPPDSSIVNRAVGFSHINSTYFIGGVRADTVSDDVWCFEFPSKTWQKMENFPAIQHGGIAVVIDNVVYAGMGKRTINGGCNNTLWTAKLTGGSLIWNYETSYPVARQVWGGVVCNGLLYIVDDDYFLLEYNPGKNEWIKKSELPEYHRSVHCIYSVGNKIYIGFGTDDAFIVYDPLWDN